MTPQRRTIKIRMSPRVAADSLDILNIVAETFQDDDLEIDIDEALRKESNSSIVASEALEIASKTLDLQDQALKEGLHQTNTPEEAEQASKQWLQTIKGEGVKVSAQVILRELLSRALDMLA